MLSKHLAAGMQEQRELSAGVAHELAERPLDPRFDHHHGSHPPSSRAPSAASSPSTARNSSTRTKPTFTDVSATTTRTSEPPPTAQIRPAGASSCMNDTAPIPAARAERRAFRYKKAANAATFSPGCPI